MSQQQQPARGSPRVELYEKALERNLTMETTEFARRRDKRRRKNSIAKASRKKNR